MSPYLVSGLGAYRSDCSVRERCEETTRFGWNVGRGTTLFAFRLRSFIEARYHRAEVGDRTVQFFPVTPGLLSEKSGSVDSDLRQRPVEPRSGAGVGT